MNDPATSCGVSKARWYAASCGEWTRRDSINQPNSHWIVMSFAWDTKKVAVNHRKHGVSFEEASGSSTVLVESACLARFGPTGPVGHWLHGFSDQWVVFIAILGSPSSTRTVEEPFLNSLRNILYPWNASGQQKPSTLKSRRSAMHGIESIAGLSGYLLGHLLRRESCKVII